MLGVAVEVKFVFGRRPGWTFVAVPASALIVAVTAQLAITDPMWLQHFRLTYSAGGKWWLLALIGLVVAVMRILIYFGGAWFGQHEFRCIAMRESLRPAWIRSIRWHQWLLAAVLFVATAAHLTRYVDKKHFAVGSYLAQLGLAAVFLAINLAALIAIFAAAPVDAVSAIKQKFARLRWDRALPWILAAWVFAVSLLLGFLALDFVPHIPDELATSSRPSASRAGSSGPTRPRAPSRSTST